MSAGDLPHVGAEQSALPLSAEQHLLQLLMRKQQQQQPSAAVTTTPQQQALLQMLLQSQVGQLLRSLMALSTQMRLYCAFESVGYST